MTKLSIIEEVKRERPIEPKDNYFIVHCKLPTMTIEVGWIEKEFNEKQFKKKIRKHLGKVEITKIERFGEDYDAYIKAKKV